MAWTKPRWGEKPRWRSNSFRVFEFFVDRRQGTARPETSRSGGFPEEMGVDRPSSGFDIRGPGYENLVLEVGDGLDVELQVLPARTGQSTLFVHIYLPGWLARSTIRFKGRFYSL